MSLIIQIIEVVCFVSFQKKLKHKLDSNSAENQQQIQQHAARVYSFDDDDGPTPAKTQATSTSTATIDSGISNNASVHIVHNINNVGVNSDIKISTNVTVNQTLKSQTDNLDSNDLQCNIGCKEEPNDEIKAQTVADNTEEKDSEIDPDIVQILEAVGNDKGKSSALIDELNKFDEILNNKYTINKDSDSHESLNTPESGSMFNPDMYMDPAQSQQQQQYMAPQSQHTGPTGTLTEGGRAAEALKRMATQHQQHQPEQFGVKSAIDPFSDISETNNYPARNGYQQDYYSGNMQNRSSSTGPYPGHGSMNYPNKQALPVYSQNNKQMGPYALPAPSSQAEAGPSSLQQLQNQVAHFNHGPQMEITQTQHMQVSDGSHRMQMSQTQQIQLRQPPFPNISLTQQQGFSTSAGLGGQAAPNTSQSQTYMNDQMLQQQQMMQPKMHPDQRHMPQYVNRPPPEYKMQNGMASGHNGTTSMGPNPLQTIQNMVNQTNTQPNQVYSGKSEPSEMQNGIRTAQMSAMQQQQQQQQQQQMGMGMSQAQYSYSNQAMQRQASFPGAMTHPMGARSQRQNSPGFTSTIMRNQRPPNVNIGPDGLNISQPRHPQEWSARGPTAVNNAGMMHYRSFSTPDGNHSANTAQMHHQGQQRTMHMENIQSQQAAMMQHSNPAHTQQMMMQQRMQMSQTMGQSQGSQLRQTPPYSMTSQQGQSYPHSSSSQDDLLNLLDTPNQATDFFDVQTSGGGADTNWSDIEDILGKT